MAKTKTSFQKGHAPTKKKGVPHKKTIESVRRIEFVLGLLEETLDQDINSLEPKERVNLWNGLQEYIRPKLARTELTGKDGDALNFAPTIVLANLDEAE